MTEANLESILLDTEGVLLNIKKPFKFSSGLMSPIYPKNRVIISYPEKRKQVYEMLKAKVDSSNLEYDAVAAVAKGTMFFASILAWEKELPLLVARILTKSEKTNHKLSGFIMPGSKVLVIEDMITNGASTTGAIEKLRECGVKVTDVVSLFDFEMPTAHTGIEKVGVKIHTLSTYTNLIEKAEELKKIQKTDKKLYLEWVKDPENWGEKMGFE